MHRLTCYNVNYKRGCGMAKKEWDYYLLPTLGPFVITGSFPYFLGGVNCWPDLLQKAYGHIEIPCIQPGRWPSICWIIAFVAFLIGILLRIWWDQSRKE